MVRVFSTHFLATKQNSLRHQRSKRLFPVEDALKGDDFRKSKGVYEWLQAVTPVFDPALDAQIQMFLNRYEFETGLTILPAVLQQARKFQWRARRQPSTKRERLQAVLWIAERLPTANNDREAINQMACVLDRVDALAWHRVPDSRIVRESDISVHGLRLPEPQPETVYGQPIRVSYGIRHVTLFNRHGAIQVQCLPKTSGVVDYVQRAQTPGVVLLDKPGADGQRLWPIMGRQSTY
jgi:hypothetical protein